MSDEAGAMSIPAASYTTRIRTALDAEDEMALVRSRCSLGVKFIAAPPLLAPGGVASLIDVTPAGNRNGTRMGKLLITPSLGDREGIVLEDTGEMLVGDNAAPVAIFSAVETAVEEAINRTGCAH